MRRIDTTIALSAILLAFTGCGDGEADADTEARPARAGAETSGEVEVYGDPRFRMTREEIESGRLDASWHRVVQLDTVENGESAPNPETWDTITAASVNSTATHLPLHGDVAGPSVARVQILLDRALFSPGIIDGRWGKNTEKAVYWFQQREGLSRTGRVDEATFERLREAAGNPGELVKTHTLTQDDVSGPFVTLPEDIYDQSELDCMCYESLEEKLSERFHITPELLQKLNPDADLSTLSAGDRIAVPAVRDRAAPRGDIARLVVSDEGYYLHALDAQGRILYHFPTTLGSDYSPSPSGDYRVTAIAPDPTWHYQPDILEGVPDDEEDAIIPPGPNNAVGVVWMALSKPHYGIHGTNAPETIGYATSNGCVRLTNWDAEFLSGLAPEGVQVEFRDVDNPGSASDE